MTSPYHHRINSVSIYNKHVIILYLYTLIGIIERQTHKILYYKQVVMELSDYLQAYNCTYIILTISTKILIIYHFVLFIIFCNKRWPYGSVVETNTLCFYFNCHDVYGGLIYLLITFPWMVWNLRYKDDVWLWDMDWSVKNLRTKMPPKNMQSKVFEIFNDKSVMNVSYSDLLYDWSIL